jgi:hypothetical protein
MRRSGKGFDFSLQLKLGQMVNNDATLNDLQVNGTVLRYVRKK